MDEGVATGLLSWVYSDSLSGLPSQNDDYVLSLMRTANEFRLGELLRKCEDLLMCSVNVGNCIKFYSLADEIDARGLKEHCAELIATNWVRGKTFYHTSSGTVRYENGAFTYV